MRDYTSRQLEVGDRVVHARSGRNGGFTGKYYVHSFTASMVRLSLEPGAEVWTTVNPRNLVKVPHRGQA